MLAAMAKGPAFFSPDRYPERARERYAYVLKRMQEDKIAGADNVTPGDTGGPRIVPYEKPRREGGYHFVDHLMREAKTLVGMQSLTVGILHGPLDHQRQAAARLRNRRCRTGLRATRPTAAGPIYQGPNSISAKSWRASTTEQSTRAQRRGRVVKPIWQIALQSAQLPLYDVHWPAAVVLGRSQDERPHRRSASA